MSVRKGFLEELALELILGDITGGAAQGKGLRKGMVMGPRLVSQEATWLEGRAGLGCEVGWRTMIGLGETGLLSPGLPEMGQNCVH